MLLDNRMIAQVPDFSIPVTSNEGEGQSEWNQNVHTGNCFCQHAKLKEASSLVSEHSVTVQYTQLFPESPNKNAKLI